MIVRKLKYVLVVAIIWMFPNIVHADCSYERMAELSRIASNVQFSYEYEINENGTPDFTVLINNLTNDIFIKDDITGSLIIGNGEKTISYTNGSSIQFKIYSNDQNCYGEKILSQHLNIPSYNYYSNSEACQQYSDFSYCQIWMNSDIEFDDFNKALNDYKENKKVEQNSNIEKQSIWENVKIIFNENKPVIFMALICLIFLIVYTLLKRRKRRA